MSVPRKQWTPEEIEFDRIVSLCDSLRQMDRIEGRCELAKFEKLHGKAKLDEMWERIK